MDGRDIGTTVLPQAPVKIFMVASAMNGRDGDTLKTRQKGLIQHRLKNYKSN